MNIIYCYTNKINNKKYVGQTNNEQRRIREHKSNAFNDKSVNYNSIFHKAIRKYGYENFEYEKLEEIETNNQEIVDEREKYWIEQKQSKYNQHGYNILDGGKGKFWSSKFSKEEIQDIKNMIKSGCCYDEIVNKYNISKTFISNINAGLYFKDENENYPLKDYRLNNSTTELLIQYLEESDLTFSQIAKVLNIAESTVKKTNYGTLRHGLVESYPIRKITPADKKANLVIDLLLNTSYSKLEIMNRTGVSEETIRRINKGVTHKKEELTYPLRNFVETIPG